MEPAWRQGLPSFSDAFNQRYELVDLLGEGGMGRVYLGRQKQLDREVAIKVLKSLSGTDAARFAREAHVLAGFHHARIVRVFDSGIDGGTSYLVMERITEQTLEKRLRGAPLTLREALRVCARVADALAASHAEGVVHRDVKPDNVFLLDDLEIKLGDFGLAREVFDEQITASGTMMGTPQYMSPEQVAAKPVGPATDQYSLGVMLFRLVTQLYPFIGENPLSIAVSRLHQPPPSPRVHCPTLPAAVEAVILRTLQVNAVDRFGTTEELRAELDRLAEELGPEADRVYRPPVRNTRSVRAVDAPAGPTADDLQASPAPPPTIDEAAPADTRPRAAPVRRPSRNVPRLSAPAPVRAQTRTLPYILAGVAIVVGSFTAAWRYGISRPPRPTGWGASAEAATLEHTAAQDAARKLMSVLARLDPMARVEDLRRIEHELRYSRLAPEQRGRFLKPRWTAEFAPKVDALLVPDAWRVFAPLEEEFFNTASDARERLAMVNLLEDFAFLSQGLAELKLPLPFEPSPATKTARGLGTQPVVKMTAGAGFRLQRRTKGARLTLTSHPDGGVLERLDPVSKVADREIDDHFFSTAVALGAGNELPSVLDSIIKADNKAAQTNRVEYAHPKAIELPQREKLEAVAIAAYVSDLRSEHRFEIYADPQPDGPFTRRVATFRARAEGPEQLWQMVDPAVLADSRVFLKVKFVTLPGQANRVDFAELHQLTIHWRVRAD